MVVSLPIPMPLLSMAIVPAWLSIIALQLYKAQAGTCTFGGISPVKKVFGRLLIKTLSGIGNS
jgi:hypothetical protein